MPRSRPLPPHIRLHAEITESIIGAFYQVYNELGTGFLESVYEFSMAAMLTELGRATERQCPIRVYFHGSVAGTFRADLLVDRKVVVEIKACRALEAVHEAQLINYLRASSLEVGLLLNFGERPAVRRVLYTNDRKVLPPGVG